MNTERHQSEQSKSTLRVLISSLKMAVATFSSRILGLIREQSMAAIFGASGVTDAFLVAYRIPNMLRDLFAEGAFSSAFVPVFTEAKKESADNAKRLLWSMFVLLGLVTLAIAICIVIGAPQILSVIAPKFKEDPEKFGLAVGMIRLMAPFLTLVSIAALFMGALNTLKIFFLPALAPAFFNVVMILSIFFLPGYLAHKGLPTIYALSIGVIGGGIIQAAIQFPFLIKNGFGPKGPLKLISPEAKKIFHRVGIGVVGIAATQINVLINTILATGTVVGAVSWLTYAFRLFQFPVGILGVSLAGSNLVHFSDAWKSGDQEEAKRLLSSSYFLSLLAMTPAAVLLWVLSDQAVNLVFQRGEFVFRDTFMTGMVLRFYVIGLPCYGIYKIFAPTFYALDKPKVPVAISVIAILINIVFCLSMVPKYGFKVLALGTTLSMIINTMLQGTFLARYLNLSFSFFLNLRVGKLILPLFLCFLTAQYFSGIFYNYEASVISRLIGFLFSAGMGGAAYVLTLLALGEHETLLKLFRNRKKLS